MVSIIRREMLIDGGNVGSVAASNQRAYSISTRSGVMSPPACSAVNATIN